VLVLRDNDSEFANALPGVPRQNFNDFSVLAGLAYDVDGVIGFRLLAGYEERDFRSKAYKTIQAPIVEGSVTWAPTGLTTITGSAARYIEDSASEATVGYTETALKLSIDHELYRNVVLNAKAAAYLDDYAAGGGSQSFYTVGAGVTWTLSRVVRLVADYTYSSRETNDAAPFATGLPLGGVFGGSYSENVFRIRLRLAL
jgi:hypothetical protein